VGDGLKHVHWHVGLSGVELAPLHVRPTSSALRSAIN
jgi:hypothetical protein